jgi:hypothetical protein
MHFIDFFQTPTLCAANKLHGLLGPDQLRPDGCRPQGWE